MEIAGVQMRKREVVKLGVVIPDRKDRPDFLRHCLAMLRSQTRKADSIVVVDGPTGLDRDITLRYKSGLHTLFVKENCDAALLWENDDWYCRHYNETMLDAWKYGNRPDILGIGETVYYHIGQRRYKVMKHPKRASAFCTMVTPAALAIKWPQDTEPFLDLHLWQQMKGVTFVPDRPLAIGIKHGVGSCGGRAHGQTFPYDHDDKDMKYLASIVDEDSLKFYRSL